MHRNMRMMKSTGKESMVAMRVWVKCMQSTLIRKALKNA